MEYFKFLLIVAKKSDLIHRDIKRYKKVWSDLVELNNQDSFYYMMISEIRRK